MLKPFTDYAFDTAKKPYPAQFIVRVKTDGLEYLEIDRHSYDQAFLEYSVEVTNKLEMFKRDLLDDLGLSDHAKKDVLFALVMEMMTREHQCSHGTEDWFTLAYARTIPLLDLIN